MASCWACETQLDPAWRFCIHCGVPVERDDTAPTRPVEAEPTWGPGRVSLIVIAGAILVFAIVAVIVAVVRQ